MFLGGQVLLGAAAAALGAAGWRAGGRLTTAALERALVAAVLAVCALVAEALLLGRIGAGGSPAALSGAAAGTLLAARLLIADSAGRPWWPALGERDRWALGAAAGALLALVAWMLRHPAVGIDATVYHLPEALGWVRSGSTGSTPHVLVEFQAGSYPLTHEVVLSWAMAISRSFTPAALWAGWAVALLAVAVWAGLRRLGCGRGVAALALAALLAEPVLAEHLNKPKNDVPSLAFLAAALALCACAAPRGGQPPRPRLLAVALAAAGLAIGAKTTAAPLALIGLLAAAWACRGVLWRARGALALGAVAALGVGGVWYLRNLIAHGWLFWPFGSGPFGGDPEPAYLRRIDVSFLGRPRYTLAGREAEYVRAVAGGLLLAAGGVAAGLLRPRSRLVAGAAAATAVAALAWMAAPFTGRTADPVLDLSLTTVRYLLPVFLAGAAALALAGRGRGGAARGARALLAAALAWNLARTAQIGFPDLPAAGTLLAGAALGAVAAAVAASSAARLRVVAVLAAAGMAVVSGRLADGWLGHAAESAATPMAPLEAFFARQPGWTQDRTPVAFVTNVVGPLAGDRLRHPLELIPGDEPCVRTLARLRDEWVVVRDIAPAFRALLAPVRAPACLAGVRPAARPEGWLVYRQTATTSRQSGRSPAASAKSERSIAASAGVWPRRNSVSSRS